MALTLKSVLTGNRRFLFEKGTLSDSSDHGSCLRGHGIGASCSGTRWRKNSHRILKNTKTLSVKTFIVGRDAAYRFTELSPNVDYELWAEYQGAKSDAKTVSSFDSRPQAHINLKVNTK